MSWLLSWGHVSQRTRAFISVSYVLSLPFPPFPFPSFDDPSFTRLAFLCRTFCHPLWISFLSLSLPTALKGPLVCLTTLWLPDLCIQCVITGPTLSCKSLFDWLSDCSGRHSDPLCIIQRIHLCTLHVLISHFFLFLFQPFLQLLFFRSFSLVGSFFLLFALLCWLFSLIITLLASASAFLCVSPAPLPSPSLIFSKCFCVISEPQKHALGTLWC